MKKIRYYFNFIMIALYAAIGLLFLFTDVGADTFPMYRTALGITFLVYGIIRTILTIRKIRQDGPEN